MINGKIMFLNIITPLHNGSGEGLGIVDNPIMRERTTQFPIIQASSIKGVLRDAYYEKDHSCVNSLFGPSPNGGSDYAGAISFGEGQILAFPVRSFKGCIAWITSPRVLWRFYQKVEIVGIEDSFPSLLELIPKIHSEIKIKICPNGENELLIDGNLLLEEYLFNCKNTCLSELGDFAFEISELVFRNELDKFIKEEFEKKLVLVDDDTFRYFVNNATEIVANIRIDKNGTTKDGSLRYTEYLPSETIMYSTLNFEKSKNKIKPLSSSEVEKYFIDYFAKIQKVQIGGDETIGKGIVKLTLAGGLELND